MTTSERANPAHSQDPPAVPPTAKQEKTDVNDSPQSIAGRRLSVAFAPHKNSFRWEQLAPMTWAELLVWLDLDNPADHKECGGYVGGLLRDGTRKRSHVEFRSVLVLDADKAGPLFPNDVARVLPAVAAVVHSTWSHGVEGLRYRLLVPLSRDLTAQEYQRLAPAVRDALGQHWGDDKGGPEPERFMYRPSTQKGISESHVLDGELLDVDAWLAVSEPEQDEAEEAPAQHKDTPLHPYAARAIEAELARLDACALLGHAGPPWNNTTFQVACVLIEFANSPWSGYTMDAAEADLLKRAPSDEGCVLPGDEGFGPAEHAECWTSALKKVGTKGRPHPAGDAAEDFAALGGEPTVAVDEAAYQRDVEKEARRLRVQQAARELVARSLLDDTPVLRPTNLADFLAEPDDDVRYRVDRLLPTGGRVVFAAPNKAGKTTTIGNLVRCLVDGGRFLDEFVVERAERVVLLDNELDPRMIRSWLRDQAIVNAHAVGVLSLRGRLSGFNILDPVVRSEWARAIGAADMLVFDCLRPALDALGLSEDKDAGRFLVALDELIAEAGVQELVVVHHMGHSNERSRGDSRILDWPDALWKIVKENPEDHSSARFFSAYGRDVSHPESRLAFDPENRHLSLAGGSRHEARASRTETDLLNFALENPGSSQSALVKGVSGDTNALRQGVRNLLAAGLLRVEVEGQKHAHYVVEPGSDFAEEV